MIPLAVPNLCGKERENLNKCIDSTFVSTVGEFVQEFEEQIKKSTGASGVVCVNTGTAAIHAGLVALGVKPGDLVILPSLTFIASANAIAYTGAEPWLMDIENDSWTIDSCKLRTALQNKTKRENGELIHIETGKRVSVLMPVYTLGCPANMNSINEVANEFGLKVLADGAAAIGSQYNEKPIGNLADITTLSFNGNKTITSGGGGAILCKEEDLAKKVKHLTTTARIGPEYYHDEIGFNYRMTNIEAAVGCAQIENLQKFVNRKREVAGRYLEAFSVLNGCEGFPEPTWAKSAFWFSGVLLKEFNIEQIKKIRNELNSFGIMARPFWMPIHLQPQFQNAPREDQTISDSVWEKILVLPCSTGISDQEIQEVIDTTTRLINGNNV